MPSSRSARPTLRRILLAVALAAGLAGGCVEEAARTTPTLSRPAAPPADPVAAAPSPAAAPPAAEPPAPRPGPRPAAERAEPAAAAPLPRAAAAAPAETKRREAPPRRAPGLEQPAEEARAPLPTAPPDPIAYAVVPKPGSPSPETPQPEGKRAWVPLDRDGIHDRKNPQLGVLQSPAEALAALPPAAEGNQVDWIRAQHDGAVKPVTALPGAKPREVLDLDIIRRNTRFMSYVRFPHRQHTELLACSNCHDKPFEMKAGAAKI